MPNRVLSLVSAGLLVLVALLAACASQPAPAPASTQAPTAAPAKAEPTAPPQAPAAAPAKTAPAAAAPRVGGTVVYNPPQMDANGLDPHSVGARSSGILLNYLGSGLVTRDLTTGQIAPSLAESWKVSADGLTYEFKIRKNAKFHDGTPITAGDYAFTFRRHMDPALKSPTAGRTWGSVASAEAPDDYTLVIHMKAPDITFLRGLALTPASNQPVPKNAVEKMGDRFTREPVLSGPFKFKESQVGVKVVLERNPDFTWGAPPNSGPANIQTLEFRDVRDYATILAGLESGEIDISTVRVKDIDRLKATGKITVAGISTGGLFYVLNVNTSKAPWDDVRVRKAINLAMDRQAMSKVLSNGLLQEARGPIAKGFFGYWPGAEQIGYGFDLNQAKALMREAGYTPGSDGTLQKDGNSLRFSLKADSRSPFDQEAVLIKEQLKALGIDVAIQQAPPTEVTADILAGKFDLAASVSSGQPDGILLLNEVFHSSMIGAMNFNRVSDPKLDELVAAARRAPDEKKALEIAAEAQKLAIEKAYLVPLLVNRTDLAISNRVKGFVANENTFIFPNLTGAYVEGGR